jgi:hypothetical protein
LEASCLPFFSVTPTPDPNFTRPLNEVKDLLIEFQKTKKEKKKGVLKKNEERKKAPSALSAGLKR